MEISAHIEAIRREGILLAAAVEASHLDSAVPSCPEWRLRDLVAHIGGVHRWARAHVAEGRLKPLSAEEEQQLFAGRPDDASLLEWFRAGHVALVRTLEAAPPDVRCWSFLPAPTPLAFWARRQAHETGIHRVDAQLSAGSPTPLPTSIAADGIDELLYGFVSRPGGKLRADVPHTLLIQADDADRTWFVRIGAAGAEVSEHGTAPDCAVHGSASDLFLLLWNRRAADGLGVGGDRAVLDLWRESVRIRWS